MRLRLQLCSTGWLPVKRFSLSAGSLFFFFSFFAFVVLQSRAMPFTTEQMSEGKNEQGEQRIQREPIRSNAQVGCTQ